MAKVEIYGIPRSSCTRVVRLVCEEKGIDYELKAAPPHSPEVNAIHPFGKLPVMRHGDFTLCESKAIATYLDRSFPGPRLIPADPRLAALAEQWVSLVNSVMDGTLVRTYVFAYIFPKGADGKPDRTAIDAVTPALNQQLQLLDQAVAKIGHLVGDGVTSPTSICCRSSIMCGSFPKARRRWLRRHISRNTTIGWRRDQASPTPFPRTPACSGSEAAARRKNQRQAVVSSRIRSPDIDARPRAPAVTITAGAAANAGVRGGRYERSGAEDRAGAERAGAKPARLARPSGGA
jgi:glutathione S-transferase